MYGVGVGRGVVVGVGVGDAAVVGGNVAAELDGGAVVGNALPAMSLTREAGSPGLPPIAGALVFSRLT